MYIIHNISELRQIIIGYKQSGKVIAFVPTMGYLHDGHLSLVNKAKETCNCLVLTP